MKKPKKILLIIQRSNGDVFLSSSLIETLYKHYSYPQIDLLVNDDTLPIARLIPFVKKIHIFSYKEKKNNRWSQEKAIFKKIFRKYDLSINLTASDRSVIYSILASRESISAIENEYLKSWWKKIVLSYFYYFDSNKHILINNSEPLNCLKINHNNIHKSIDISPEVISNVTKELLNNKITKYIIFHPSAQYNYKVYPKNLRNKLLLSLNELGIPIIITGGKNKIDSQIKKEIPEASNIYNLIGKTSLEEYFALSQMCLAYIGMDTLNMHIAASQNKRIFAIFGPTKLSMWSPWSNELQHGAKKNKSIQSYDNITIFQSSTPCSVCGKVGCGSNHGKDQLTYSISPDEVFIEVKNWLNSLN